MEATERHHPDCGGLRRVDWMRDGTALLCLEAELPAQTQPVWLRLYYERLYRQLCRYCKRELLPAIPAEGSAAPLRLTHRICLETPTLLCIRCDLNAGRRSAACFSAVWDRASGTPLPLRAFFPDTRRLRRRLRARLDEELQRRERCGEALLYPDYRLRLRRAWDPDNFFIEEAGLTLFFPPLSLGPAAEGIPCVLLPWSPDGPVLPQGETCQERRKVL